MLSATLILFLAAVVAVFVVPVPRRYRFLAITNFIVLAAFAFIFSEMTGNADRGVDTLKFYLRGPIAWQKGFESIFQAQLMYFLSGAVQSIYPISYLAFNFIGALLFSYVGLAMIMRMNPDPTQNVLLIWWIFTLLPGVHFWHSVFGKEALQLLAIGCFFGFKRTSFKLAALGLLLLVRPHIGMLLAAAEIVRIIMARKRIQDVFVIFVAIVICFLALSYLVERLNGNNLSIEVLLSLFSGYGEEWSSSSLRLNDTSSILAYPDFFLRPYPFEVSSLFHLLTSIESIALVLLLFAAMYVGSSKPSTFTAWVFLVFLCVVLPLVNPNVGTSTRKKQIFPVCSIVIFSAIRRRKWIQIQGRNQHVRRISFSER